MIFLNLQLFGGRGSGGGGGGGGSGGGKGKSNGATPASATGPGGRGSAGGRKGMTAGSTAAKRDSISSHEKVTAVNEAEQYILLEYKSQKETNPRAASGKQLMTLIRSGKLRYDKSRGIWVSTSNKRYIVRKK